MEKIVDMTDALKQVREYKKEPEQEKLVVTKTDKKINSPAYQSYKAGDTTLIDLEEQKRQLEEEIKCLSEEMDSMIQEKRQEGFAVRYSLDGKRLVQAYKTEKDAEQRAKILKSMGGVKDVSITKHTLNFKEEVLDEFTNFKSITFKPKGKYVSDGKYEIVYDYGRKALVTKKQLNVWLTQKFIEEELKEGGENDRVRELLQKQETKGLSNSEKKELRELIKTISAGYVGEDEQLSQNESFVDKWANILKIKVGDKVKFVDKGGAHFGKKGKVIRDHGDGSYSVEILFPSGRTLTPNNVKNKDIVKEEVLEESSEDQIIKRINTWRQMQKTKVVLFKSRLGGQAPYEIYQKDKLITRKHSLQAAIKYLQTDMEITREEVDLEEVNEGYEGTILAYLKKYADKAYFSYRKLMVKKGSEGVVKTVLTRGVNDRSSLIYSYDLPPIVGVNEGTEDDKAYAIGMSKAKEIKKDSGTPLKKSTIEKGHEIAKAIKKNEAAEMMVERVINRIHQG